MNALLLYGIADTFRTSLVCDTETSFSGRKDVQLAAGPWKLDTYFYVTSEVVTDEVVSAFVKLRKGLWAYVVSKPHDLTLYLFNAKRLGIRTDEIDLWMTRSVQDTINKLKPGLLASLYFDETNRRWQALSQKPSHLDHGQQEQGPQDARAGTASPA
jgi:hypothetical protein